MPPDNPWAAPRARTIAKPTSGEAPDRRLFWATLLLPSLSMMIDVLAAVGRDDLPRPALLAAWFAVRALELATGTWWCWRLLHTADQRGGPGRFPALPGALLTAIPWFGSMLWVVILRYAWDRLSEAPAPRPPWAELVGVTGLLSGCLVAGSLLWSPGRTDQMEHQAGLLVGAAMLLFNTGSVWTSQARAERGVRRS